MMYKLGEQMDKISSLSVSTHQYIFTYTIAFEFNVNKALESDVRDYASHEQISWPCQVLSQTSSHKSEVHVIIHDKAIQLLTLKG